VLNRDGIRKLYWVYTQVELAQAFGISIPTYRRYMGGREPRKAIEIYINEKVDKMLGDVREKIG